MVGVTGGGVLMSGANVVMVVLVVLGGLLLVAMAIGVMIAFEGAARERAREAERKESR